VLKEGEKGGKNKKIAGITYPNIPQGMTLQEFALRHMLAEKCFDKIIIGASTMQDFQNQMYLMDKIGSDDNPLHAIDIQSSAEEETKKDKKEEEKLKSEEN
jgi:signal recognition particle GTPase